MACLFDPDLIALHAGGDLPAGQERLVETHLWACPTCQRLYAEYRQGIDMLAGSQPAVRFPHARPLARPGLQTTGRWAVAALLLALVLTAVGIGTASPVVAALLRSLGFPWLKVMDTHEATQYQQAQQSAIDRRPPGEALRVPRVTVEAAQEAVTYRLLQPTYLPKDYGLSFAVIMKPWDPTSDVFLEYQAGTLSIRQSAPGQAWEYSVPEGATEPVLVSGQPAALIRGEWALRNDTFQWDPDGLIRLVFTRDGRQISIVHGNARFPVAELIKIAESLR